jgi:hypothetical protein
MSSKLCILCGEAEADSAEHFYKATLAKDAIASLEKGLRLAIPKLDTNGKMTRKFIQGSKSASLKFWKSICSTCNGSISQRYDLDYDRIIAKYSKSNLTRVDDIFDSCGLPLCYNPNIELNEEVYQIRKKLLVLDLIGAIRYLQFDEIEQFKQFKSDIENVVNAAGGGSISVATKTEFCISIFKIHQDDVRSLLPYFAKLIACSLDDWGCLIPPQFKELFVKGTLPQTLFGDVVFFRPREVGYPILALPYFYLNSRGEDVVFYYQEIKEKEVAVLAHFRLLDGINSLTKEWLKKRSHV